MQSINKNNSNPRRVGLTPDQEIEQAYSKAQNRVQNAMLEFQRNIEKMAEPKDPSWYHYAALGPRTMMSLMEGPFYGVSGLIHTAATSYQEFANTARRMRKDETTAYNELSYLTNNFFNTITESMVTTFASGAAQLGRLGAIDPDWAFNEEDGFIARTADTFEQKRFDEKMRDNISPSGGKDQYYAEKYDNFIKEAKIEGQVPKPDEANATDEDWKNYEEELHRHARTRVLDDHYVDATKEALEGSAEFNRMLREDYIEPTLSAVFLNVDDIDPYFQDSEFYNFMQGSFQSIGNIGLSWAVSYLGAKAGVPPMITRSYFGASVFGRSHAEAIQAGSDMQSAYTFATGRAITEVIAQNLGGLKTYNWAPKAVRDSFGGLKTSSISGLVKSMGVEGFEEFLIESGRAGQYYYVGEEKGFDIGTDQELLKNLFFAFAAGAMSSGVLAGARSVMLQNTLDHQVGQHSKAFDIDVQRHGETNAVNRFEKSLNQIVETLNSRKTKGYKKNAHDQQFVGTFTQDEKVSWLSKTQLNRFIQYDSKTGIFSVQNDIEFNKDMFKNKHNGNIVNDNEYGISESVRGRELSVKQGNSTINPVKTNRLNKAGKAAIQQANENLNAAPIVIFDSKTNLSGFYSIKNGAIYINQRNLSTEKAVDLVAKHEMVHKIQNEAPEIYKEMETHVDKLIEFTINKDTQSVEVKVKSKQFDEYLKRKGYKQQMLSALADYTKTHDSEKAMEMVKNEIPAYLIEAILDGGEVNSAMTVENQTAVKTLLKHVQKDKHLKSIAKRNPLLSRRLKKVRSAFDRGVRQTRIQDNTMKFYVNNVIGIESDMSNYIDFEYLKNEYGIEDNEENRLLIMNAFMYGIDAETGTLSIQGIEQAPIHVPISKLMKTIENTNPKRISQPNYNEIYKNTQVDPEKNRGRYRRLLWEYVEVQNEIIQMLIEEHGIRDYSQSDATPAWKEYQRRASFADHIHNQLDKNKPIRKPSHIKFIRELVATDEFHHHEYNYRKSVSKDVQTIEVRAVSNAIQRFARHFNNKTGIKGWRNRTYSADRESVANWSYEVKGRTNVFEVAEGLRNAIEIQSAQSFPGEYTIGYTVYNVLDGKTDVFYRSSEQGQNVETLKTQDQKQVSPWNTKIDPNTERYIEFYAKPTEKIIEKNMKKIEEKMYREDTKKPSNQYYVDSDGKAITPFTKQRFRNTVVRDEKGKLKTMYHGTQRAWFSQFDTQSRTLGSSTVAQETFGNNEVHFFTTERNVAEFYAQTDQNVPQEVTQRYDTIKELVDTIQDLSVKYSDSEIFDQKTVLRIDGKYHLVEINYDVDLQTQSPKQSDVDWTIAVYDTRQQLLNNAFEDLMINSHVMDADSTAGIYSVYLDIQNPYGLDAENQSFESIVDPEGPGHAETTNEIINRVIEMNKNEGTDYDGVIFNNLNDPKNSDVYVTIKSKNQVQTVERDDSTSPQNIQKQFVEDVFTFFTDNRILQGNQFLTREGMNVHEITPERINLPQNFDTDNVVVGMPNFNKNGEVQTLNEASKVAPVVALAMPILWKENYTYQSKAPENMKLVYNQPYNPGVELLGYYPGKATKIVGQIWVRNNDIRFKTMPDLRKTNNDPIRHKDFKYYKLDRAAHFEAYRNYDFDFAVQIKGPATDFTQKITDFTKLDSTKNYVLIKANNTQSLNILENLDYNELAKYGSDLFIGFTGTDLVRAYTEQKNRVINPKSVTEAELTQEDHDRIKSAVGNVDVSKFFVKNRKGEFVLKNEKIVKSQKRAKDTMINGKIYKSKDYALSLEYYQEKNLKTNKDIEIRKHNEMTQSEMQLFDLFQEMGISFVFYYPTTKAGQDTLGFSTRDKNTNLVFINTELLNSDPGSLKMKQHVLSTLIHEEMHEMYKFNEKVAKEFGKKLSDVLFKNANQKQMVKNAESTEIMQHIIKVGWGSEDAFLRYLKRNYYSNVKTLADVQNILEKGKSKNTDASPNEMIAQMVGYLFSDNNVVNEIFKDGNYSEKIIPAYDMYSFLTKNVTNETAKIYLQDAFQSFEQLRQEHTKIMGKTFNKPTRYTLAELNHFIKTFTDEKFTTKNKLLKAYFKEIENKKRGDAQIALDNLLFIAKEFATIYGENIENIVALKKEFSDYKREINYVLTNEQTATFLKSEPFAKYAELQKMFGKTGKTKFVKELFNTDNVTVEQVNQIKQHFSDADKLLDAMLYSYEAINSKLLDYFNMPDKFLLENLITNIRFEINSIMADIQINDSIENVAQIDFENYINQVIELMQEGRLLDSNVATVDMQTIENIRQLLETKHTEKMNNVIRKIKSRVANVTKKFERVTKQKESVFHPEIENVMKHINQFTDLIKEHMYDFELSQEETRDKFVNILQQLDKAVQTSERIPGQDRTSLDKNAEVVYDQKAFINDNVMSQLYIQTALMLRDKSILTDRFPNSIEYTYQTIEQIAPKGLSENSLAKNFGELLQSFETKYTNLFSGHKKTTKEFAEQTTKEIDSLDKPLKVGMVSRFMRVMMTQNVLRFFQKATDGKIEFLNNLNDEYIKAGNRRISHLAQFQQEYDAFVTANKNAVEHTHNKVSVDSEYLVNMESKDQFIKTQQEAYEKAKQQKDLVQETRNEVEQLRQERKKAQIILQEAKRKLSFKLTQAERSKQLSIKLEQESIIEDKNKSIKYFVNESKVQKDKLKGLLSEEFLIKKALIEQANQENYKSAELSYGEVINLYLSVKREIEMQQNYDDGNEAISPTNHFGFGNSIEVYDVQKAAQKGFLNAKTDMAVVAINSEKQDLLSYIETLLTEQDWQIINFVQQRMNTDYESVNEIYKQQYQVDLPRQKTYIPFQSRDSDIKREYRLREVQQHNTSSPDNMTKQTMHHASNPLTITNVFDVVELSSRRAAMYSFEGFITDFHALMETQVERGPGSQSLKAKIGTQGNKLGENNKLYEAIDMGVRKIIQYGDPDESMSEKVVRKATALGVGATVGLNIPMAMKQLPTITTTLIKMNRSDLIPIALKNTLQSIAKNNKYRKWLLSTKPGEGNDQFYMRKKQGNIVSLVDTMPLGTMRGIGETTKKISRKLGFMVGRFDEGTLVGVFKTFAEDYQSKNPQATEAQVMNYANEQLQEMLLFGIANFDPAFRAPFSASKRVHERIVGRFMSENALQVSAMIESVQLFFNSEGRDLDAFRNIMRQFTALLISAFLSSVVNVMSSSARGYSDYEEEGLSGLSFDLFVNQMVWNNMIGMMPYVNQFTGMVQWSKPTVNDAGQRHYGFNQGFDFNMPLYDDVSRLIGTLASLQNGENVERKLLRAFESLGQLTGVPVRNATRTARSLTNIFKPTGNKQVIEVNKFFDSTTNQQALNQSVSKGRSREINTHIKQVYESVPVRNEIARLLLSDSEARLRLYNDPYFRLQQEDGSYKRYNIPENVHKHYNKMTERALQVIIRSSEYRRLSDDEKLKALQRIINYYNNQLRSDVKGERVKLMTLREVIDHSLRYSNR